jgi:hypothetical protein
MKRLCGVLGILGIIGIGGCGGNDDGPPAMTGIVDPAGARSVLMQTLAMQAAIQSKDGAGLSGEVNSVAVSGAQEMVQPKQLSQALTALPRAQTAAGTSGTVDCDGNGCSYKNFMVGGFTYNGTVTSSDAGAGAHKVVADLSIKGGINAGGFGETVDLKITGNTTMSPTLIDGFFQSSGSGSVSGISTPGAPSSISYTHFNQVKYKGVAINNGNASSGSMYGKWAMIVSNIPEGSQAWEGTITLP